MTSIALTTCWQWTATTCLTCWRCNPKIAVRGYRCFLIFMRSRRHRTCPIPTTAVRMASRRCRTWSSSHVLVCSMRGRSAAVLEATADLGRRNTLRLPARATWFAQPESEAELAALLQDARYQSLPRVVIGDGSNLLLRADLDALVIRPAMRGMHVVEEDDRQVLIEVMAGENWEALV